MRREVYPAPRGRPGGLLAHLWVDSPHSLPPKGRQKPLPPLIIHSSISHPEPIRNETFWIVLSLIEKDLLLIKKYYSLKQQHVRKNWKSESTRIDIAFYYNLFAPALLEYISFSKKFEHDHRLGVVQGARNTGKWETLSPPSQGTRLVCSEIINSLRLLLYRASFKFLLWSILEYLLQKWMAQTAMIPESSLSSQVLMVDVLSPLMLLINRSLENQITNPARIFCPVRLSELLGSSWVFSSDVVVVLFWNAQSRIGCVQTTFSVSQYSCSLFPRKRRGLRP